MVIIVLDLVLIQCTASTSWSKSAPAGDQNNLFFQHTDTVLLLGWFVTQAQSSGLGSVGPHTHAGLACTRSILNTGTTPFL